MSNPTFSMQGGYAAGNTLSNNTWITPPEVKDPKNIPEPLGWTLLVRPYPVKQAKTTIIMPDSDIDYMNHVSNIGRVVAVGPCCWTRPEHRDKDGNQFDWVKVGDFVEYPKNVGARKKFKGVSYVTLVDDELVDRLPDPQVFDDDFYTLDIPQAHLEKYNTIYNTKKGKK